MKTKLLILFIALAFSCNAQFYGLNQNTGTPEICQFDISTAVYDNNSFYLGDKDGAPRATEFKPDGSIMYIVGFLTDSLYQYALSTPWDISTASYNNISFYLGTLDGSPLSVRFKTDGTKMYYLGGTTDDAYQYTLSTPWDVSSASYDSKSVDLTPQDASGVDMFLSSDGIKMYYAGQTGNDTLYQYTLSSAWDISTASYDEINFGLSAGVVNTAGIYITSSGTQLFSIIPSLASILQNTLSTPWDISTASYDGISFSGVAQESTGQSIYFKADCSNFFMQGSASDSIYQYSY